MVGYFESNDYKKRINERIDVTLGGVRATKTSTRRIRDCCRLRPQRCTTDQTVQTMQTLSQTEHCFSKHMAIR